MPHMRDCPAAGLALYYYVKLPKVLIMKRLFFVSLILMAITRISHAQWSHDPGVNNPVSTQLGDQSNPKMVSDGAGGNLITWLDTRSGSGGIYSQRINAIGLRHC